MKRIFILSLLSVLMLSACGTNDGTDKNSSNRSKSLTNEASSESNLDIDNYDSKLEEINNIKSANANAKLLFTTINNECADLFAFGEQDVISIGVFDLTEISELSDDDVLQQAVKRALSDNGETDGKVYWEIDENYDVIVARYQSSDGEYIGQYPDPTPLPDDPETELILEAEKEKQERTQIKQEQLSTPEGGLKIANSNAKLLFTTINNKLADMYAEGNTDEINDCCSGQVVSVDSLANSNSPIDVAIYNALMDNGTSGGYVYFELDDDYNVIFAQWSESQDFGIVGQYPEPETDSTALHTVGIRF